MSLQARCSKHDLICCSECFPLPQMNKWANCTDHIGCKVVHMDGPAQSAYRTLPEVHRLEAELAQAQIDRDCFAKETADAREELAKVKAELFEKSADNVQLENDLCVLKGERDRLNAELENVCVEKMQHLTELEKWRTLALAAKEALQELYEYFDDGRTISTSSVNKAWKVLSLFPSEPSEGGKRG